MFQRMRPSHGFARPLSHGLHWQALPLHFAYASCSSLVRLLQVVYIEKVKRKRLVLSRIAFGAVHINVSAQEAVPRI